MYYASERPNSVCAESATYRELEVENAQGIAE
jgi:hypothetical protein